MDFSKKNCQQYHCSYRIREEYEDQNDECDYEEEIEEIMSDAEISKVVYASDSSDESGSHEFINELILHRIFEDKRVFISLRHLLECFSDVFDHWGVSKLCLN